MSETNKFREYTRLGANFYDTSKDEALGTMVYGELNDLRDLVRQANAAQMLYEALKAVPHPFGCASYKKNGCWIMVNGTPKTQSPEDCNCGIAKAIKEAESL